MALQLGSASLHARRRCRRSWLAWLLTDWGRWLSRLRRRAGDCWRWRQSQCWLNWRADRISVEPRWLRGLSGTVRHPAAAEWHRCAANCAVNGVPNCAGLPGFARLWRHGRVHSESEWRAKSSQGRLQDSISIYISIKSRIGYLCQNMLRWMDGVFYWRVGWERGLIGSAVTWGWSKPLSVVTHRDWSPRSHPIVSIRTVL